jgi:hypothetical protein
MMKFAIATATFGTLAAATVGLAGAAAAAPLGGDNAADAISRLQADGYNVQLNPGISNAPLANCTATGIHGLPSNSDIGLATQPTTVFVDVYCPETGNI